MSWPTSGENPYTLFLQKEMSLRAVGSSPEPSSVVLDSVSAQSAEIFSDYSAQLPRNCFRSVSLH